VLPAIVLRPYVLVADALQLPAHPLRRPARKMSATQNASLASAPALTVPRPIALLAQSTPRVKQLTPANSIIAPKVDAKKVTAYLQKIVKTKISASLDV
jgi:hypothetical protein